MTDKERKILEMQAPSTRKCLERSHDLDIEWLNRPMPTNAQCLKKDGSADLNIRIFKSGEEEFYSNARHQQGARIEEIRSRADGYTASRVHLAPEKRDRAEKAHLGALKTIKERFKAMMDGIFEKEYHVVVAEQMEQKKKEFKE